MSSRDKYLQRTYGITEDDYEALLRAHDGRCWICGREPKVGGRRLHVEHDHSDGRVRGLTCWSCNRLLRQARDNPVTLQAAVGYLLDEEADRILEKGT